MCEPPDGVCSKTKAHTVRHRYLTALLL